MGVLRQEYPRPHFQREDWLSLNGEWDFAFDDNNEGLLQNWFAKDLSQEKIMVPFAYQTKLSGIHSQEQHPVVWYQKDFELPSRWQGKRVLINFNAVDYQTILWINGKLVGSNKGGYVGFSFDVTDYLIEGNNKVTLRVEDYPETTQPRGKQSARDESWECWYTPITGIWQSVWLEAVGNTYLDHIKIEPDIDTNTATIKYWLDNPTSELTLECRVLEGSTQVALKEVEIEARYNRFSNLTPVKSGEFTIKIDQAKIWSPEDPNLYDLEFRLYQNEKLIDQVSTYLGMRKVSVKDGRVYLNNQPYYLRMILDQGYWPDGIYTASSVEEIKKDVERTKEFGFNGARKHQKFEDPYYYYYCDKLGLLTWCEMAAGYYYDEEVSANITDEWQRLVVEHYNFPSVMAWVPINESWGVDQLTDGEDDPRLAHHLVTMYHLTKSIDPTRLVVGNDGWQQAVTDLVAIHDYTQDPEDFKQKYEQFKTDRHTKAFTHKNAIFLDGFDYQEQPILITEFGGVKVREQGAKGWGYGNEANDYEEMLQRIASLVKAIENEPEICGYCYTQLTDVEQEVNGLMTYDRKPKVDASKFRSIFQGE